MIYEEDNIALGASEAFPGKIHYGNDFLRICTADNAGKPYYYAERKGKDSVAFILYNDTHKKYGLIHEWKPPLQEWLVTAFGGSIDSHKSVLEIVRQECKEEAGYNPCDGHIQFMGKHFVSTQMNQFCYLYLVSVQGYEQHILSLEEEEQRKLSGEHKSTPVWMTYEQVLDTQCWKAKTILHMELYKKGITHV